MCVYIRLFHKEYYSITLKKLYKSTEEPRLKKINKKC